MRFADRNGRGKKKINLGISEKVWKSLTSGRIEGLTDAEYKSSISEEF